MLDALRHNVVHRHRDRLQRNSRLDRDTNSSISSPSHSLANSDDNNNHSMGNNSNNNNNNNRLLRFPVVLSTDNLTTCSSGFGSSSKEGVLSRVASMEELHEYARTQSLLEKASSVEEALAMMDTTSATNDGRPSLATSNSANKNSKRSFRRSKVFDKIGHAFHAAGKAVGQKLTAVEGFVFPHTPHFGASANKQGEGPVLQVTPKVKGGVLLRGCYTDEEHNQLKASVVAKLKTMHGEEGLRATGFEYRMVQLEDDGSVLEPKQQQVEKTEATESPTTVEGEEGLDGRANVNIIPQDGEGHDATISEEGKTNAPELTTTQIEGDPNDTCTLPQHKKDCDPATSEEEKTEATTMATEADGEDTPLDTSDPTKFASRLFHVESNTMITPKNRKEFIADGDMYDAIARVCQQYAQEVMIRDGDLEWVTVCEAGNNPEPIRALVSKALSEDEANLDKTPTLLIATGKGKVRAGIFSRQHLILSGMECSTAIPIVREAKKRGMNIVMIDPNVHGDRLGMVTFEKSMSRVFRRWESGDESETTSPDRPPLAQRDLFVLSHSQSGAQFARYLLDKSEHYSPHIRAVAFTDSTHNIQWAKKKEDLHQLLQSDKCVYFKCSKESNDDVLQPLETVGAPVETDHFWQHRFGNIDTRCAGTT